MKYLLSSFVVCIAILQLLEQVNGLRIANSPSFGRINSVKSTIRNDRRYFRKSSSQLKYSPLEELSVVVYDLQLDISNNLLNIFSHPTLWSGAFLLSAGVLSSLSPCCLSMVPLTALYLSGVGAPASSTSVASGSTSISSEDASRRTLSSLLYAAGLAFTFTSFGLVAALTGKMINPDESIGAASSLLTAAFAVTMGLNLLEIVKFSFPSIDLSEQRKQLNLPWQMEPFVFGATAALVLSPCSSPVLASLLALVGNSQNPTLGALYLFLFSLGYSLPTVYAVNSSLNFAQSSTAAAFGWVNPLFGSLLLTFGTYFTLDAGSKLLLSA